jgi:hypothetical protein
MARQGAQPRARCIDQDRLKRFTPLGALLREQRRISGQSLNRTESKPRRIRCHPFETPRRAVNGPDLTHITHEFRKVRGLTAGSCTSIQNSIPRLGIQQGSHPLRRTVLNTPMSLRIPRPIPQITAVAQHLQPIRAACNRTRFDSCLRLGPDPPARASTATD